MSLLETRKFHATFTLFVQVQRRKEEAKVCGFRYLYSVFKSLLCTTSQITPIQNGINLCNFKECSMISEQLPFGNPFSWKELHVNLSGIMLSFKSLVFIPAVSALHVFCYCFANHTISCLNESRQNVKLIVIKDCSFIIYRHTGISYTNKLLPVSTVISVFLHL